MDTLILTPKSREKFLADRFAIQPEETVVVYASELSQLLIDEENARRQLAIVQQKLETAQALLAAKSETCFPPLNLIKLYA